MRACAPVALIVHHRARGENRHRGAGDLRVRPLANARLLRCTTHCSPGYASQPFRTYLALRLDLEPHKIAELVLKVFPHGLPPVQERKAVYVTAVDARIVNSATRLMECLAQPGDVELLAPLVVDEILIRLLRSRIAARVAQMGFAESSVHRLAKAISWLRANFSQPMKVEELAELVHMSVSSFHEHFRSVTTMSPRHYQKVLGLQEARRLMLSAMMDAGAAGQQVGYLSASQFSGEYSCFFGSAPSKDIARLRNDSRPWV